jgi:Na+-driven multidrug efflux pump
VSTLLRLAAPNVLIMVAQSCAGLIETFFVGKLGTDALAGMALVFPVVMLMQTISAGAFGGAIASTIARALGSGRRGDADTLVLHSLAIALGMGLLFMVAVLLGGRGLFGLMGARGGALRAATDLFKPGVWRRGAGVGVQLAGGGDPRHRKTWRCRPS